MRIILVAASLVLIHSILGIKADSQHKGPSLNIHEIDSPAGAESGEPNLLAAIDGRVYLSWIESAGEKAHALRFAVRTAGKWSDARTIIEGNNLLVNWADFPSLVSLSDGTLLAHWLVKGIPGSHAYDINVSRSTDGGKTWSKPLLPHRDGTKTEHGFVSMLPLSAGGAGAIWLDGRNFQQNVHEAHGSSTNEMTLRYAKIERNDQISDEILVDARVCDCCQTSAAVTSEGLIVAYRDRSENEIRDISVVRLIKGRWTEPRTLNADGWEIHGCPVNGPSVSADGKRVAVAWFTAAKEVPKVRLAFSDDAGVTFNAPIPIDEGSPVGRVDVLMLTDGSALVSWLERTADGGQIKVRRVRANGSRDMSTTVSASSVARTSGFPQMARAGDEIIFAWTDPGASSKVRTAIGKLVSK